MSSDILRAAAGRVEEGDGLLIVALDTGGTQAVEVGKALAAELRRMASVLEGTCDCHWPAEPFNLARLILGGSDA